MSILAALKFVQGSIAKKDLLEGLTNFRISGGFVRGYNGVISLCSPIGTDLDFTPKAEPMLKAILACDDEVEMNIMPNGKLQIKSGGFRAAVETLGGPTAHVEPEGTLHDVDGATLLAGLTTVLPFVSDDASRPWTTGVLVKGGCLAATNNASIIQYWYGSIFPVDCVIPRMAVKELLRIKKPPVQVQVTDQSMTFHYDDGRWLRTQLLAMEWPNIDKIIDIAFTGAAPYQLDSGVFDAIEKIKPFCEKDGKVFIESGHIRTHYNPDDGAGAILRESVTIGKYNADILMQLKGLATQWDASRYMTPDERGLPPPIVFLGDNMRGVIVGFRE